MKRLLPLLGLAVGLAAAASVVARATPPAYVLADRKAARSIELRLADVGPGWTDSAGNGRRSPYLLDVGKVLSGADLACEGLTQPTKTQVDLEADATAVSTYAASTGTLISTATIMKADGRATLDFRASVGLIKGCIGPIFAKSLRNAGFDARLASSVRRRFPTGAPLSAAYRVVVDIGSKSRRAHVYLDSFLQVAGRAEVTTAVISIGNPPDSPFEQRVTGTLARRMTTNVPA